MQSCARYALAIYRTKLKGVPLSVRPIINLPQPQFGEALAEDQRSVVLACLITLGEALRNIKEKRSTWATTKLYYSCFYALRANLLLDELITFHTGKTEFICDTKSGCTQELGSSSHNFHWNRITNISRLSRWVYRPDSGEAYAAMRVLREDANYKRDFPDPRFVQDYGQVIMNGVEKSYRSYKSDQAFFYTYLADHRVIAYPVKLVAEAAGRYIQLGYALPGDQRKYLDRLWPFKNVGLW